MEQVTRYFTLPSRLPKDLQGHSLLLIPFVDEDGGMFEGTIITFHTTSVVLCMWYLGCCGGCCSRENTSELIRLIFAVEYSIATDVNGVAGTVVFAHKLIQRITEAES